MAPDISFLFLFLSIHVCLTLSRHFIFVYSSRRIDWCIINISLLFITICWFTVICVHLFGGKKKRIILLSYVISLLISIPFTEFFFSSFLFIIFYFYFTCTLLSFLYLFSLTLVSFLLSFLPSCSPHSPLPLSSFLPVAPHLSTRTAIVNM